MRKPIRFDRRVIAASIFILLIIACAPSRLRSTIQSSGFSPAWARSWRADQTISA